MKPKISIYNDHDMRHYYFMRDSKTPRGAFDPSWEEIGHRLAPIVAIVCVLAALLIVSACRL